MSAREVVTFTLPSGAKVTTTTEQAARLGWTAPEPEKPAPKRAPRKRKPTT